MISYVCAETVGVNSLCVLLTQEGKISVNEALRLAEQIGVITNEEQQQADKPTEPTVYNFSVYKWSKTRAAQRLILQVCVCVCARARASARVCVNMYMCMQDLNKNIRLSIYSLIFTQDV